jgi:2-succinyl-5-enolpyruvyl-6-hydroxy-3-cyclohexene-1-carboxylate synthase
MTSEQVLADFAGSFVDELARCGVRHVVVCPGSRSTPLAVLLDRHPAIRVWMHLDERSAAFFALGIARGLRQPAAVLCTSGTATANFLPAVVEAHYGRVPLIALTADRPPELQGIGAPQTIDQERLYGRHVKWFADAGLPENAPEALRAVRTLAVRAVSTATSVPRGPVHLNFPFREPLLPAWRPAVFSSGELGARVYDAPAVVEADVAAEYADVLSRMHRGIIVCGPSDEPGLAEAVSALSHSLGFPILADPLSQVRCGPYADQIISAYDAVLRDQEVAASLRPEVIVRFGAVPTSKPLTTFIAASEGRQILVDAAGWNDPTGTITDLVHADPVHWCRSVTSALAGERRKDWLRRWQDVQQTASEAISRCLAELDEPFEGKVFGELAHLLHDGSTLFVSSSMPVRDLDSFFPALTRPIRFLANRGANGIDGVISTALGASLAAPLVLVTGDLAFYHDMNGLLAARLHRMSASIILLNNDGGGIFSFLPQAGLPEFESLFGTPHGLDFRPAVEMYGGTFARPQTWTDFRVAAREAMAAPGLSVVEVRTERERNVTLHREIWKAVSAALERERVAL